MDVFIKNKKFIIELGSGNGASKDILKSKKIILTDIQKYPWIDKKVDMTKLNLEKKYKKKVDVFIINHALHHCSNPAKLLKTTERYQNDQRVLSVGLGNRYPPTELGCPVLVQPGEVLITADSGELLGFGSPFCLSAIVGRSKFQTTHCLNKIHLLDRP